MAKKIVYVIVLIFVASAILVTSILRSAAVRYSFKLEPTPRPSFEQDISVEYELPYPGRVTPTNILWPLKVVRDKAWLAVTTNDLKKAEIALLLSDKRLSAGIKLFELGKAGDAISVIIKGEYYLEESLKYAQKARQGGMETKIFFNQLALASLKHREILETLRVQAPEDAQPIFNKTTDFSKRVYEQTSHILQEIGETPPSNPFGN